ncbi:MAG: D-alanyl-D-alanine carboxypeptidase/D-alanyl-D-alanine-endopeptidase [Acidimicrobiales bacterium]
MRVAVVLVLVAALGAGSGWGYWQSEREPEPEARAEALAATPLLSMRRTPEVLLRPRRDAAVTNAVAGLPERIPGDSCLTVSEEGRVLFEHRAATPLIPASTQKLMVGATLFDLVDPDTTFETGVWSTEAPVDGAVGDLWLVGGGDPLLATEPYRARNGDEPRVYTHFEELADAVVDAGIERVEGAIVGDGTRYDQLRDVPSWLDRYREQVSAGPLSGLTVNQGLTTFTPELVAVNPGVPAEDPPAHAAAVLTDLLEERGVVVAGPASSGEVPPDATEITAISSPPVRTVVAHMMQWSDNTTAELLLKEIGVRGSGEGSTAVGGSVVVATLAEMGVRTDDLVISDGSGLDLGNRATCQTLLDVLDVAGSDSDLASTLAVVGESGTLRNRLLDTPAAGRVEAKTGSLRHTTALAGFARAADGRVFTFSIISNLEEGEFMPAEGSELQDELMLTLAGIEEIDVPAELEPLEPRSRTDSSSQND